MIDSSYATIKDCLEFVRNKHDVRIGLELINHKYLKKVADIAQVIVEDNEVEYCSVGS